MEKIQQLAVKAQIMKNAADERGAAGVEYGLLVALIAAVIVATVALLGTHINTAFQTVLNKLP
jgi:pilus assembly protein Flp/PilA